ncbi:LuxR C-terminal-related transcriptional regulator [Bacteroides fragilis]|nr:LuxR C-terminal-related transcriptional regulator [Bacteroides fragilis]MCY6333518.1 LuxR C-terminal-related transcriptional regulator [Bacteroides fragilis]
MTSELKLWAAFNALHLQPSNKEIQFCCLILENKTTEEIAELQYIAPSTVRSNRSRLRQKLQIGQETDLQEYLLELIKKDFD